SKRSCVRGDARVARRGRLSVLGCLGFVVVRGLFAGEAKLVAHGRHFAEDGYENSESHREAIYGCGGLMR
ncbi:MAG TPA: hypothetical protein VF215_02760, partial [Thermoanaerobaculia bacterium]